MKLKLQCENHGEFYLEVHEDAAECIKKINIKRLCRKCQQEKEEEDARIKQKEDEYFDYLTKQRKIGELFKQIPARYQYLLSENLVSEKLKIAMDNIKKSNLRSVKSVVYTSKSLDEQMYSSIAFAKKCASSLFDVCIVDFDVLANNISEGSYEEIGGHRKFYERIDVLIIYHMHNQLSEYQKKRLRSILKLRYDRLLPIFFASEYSNRDLSMLTGYIYPSNMEFVFC